MQWLQDEGRMTNEDGNARNGSWRSAFWETSKRRWSDDITDRCGCILPEAVQLASDRKGGEKSLI